MKEWQNCHKLVNDVEEYSVEAAVQGVLDCDRAFTKSRHERDGFATAIFYYTGANGQNQQAEGDEK